MWTYRVWSNHENGEGGDGCSADCRSDETCGKGYIDRDAGEICDSGGLAYDLERDLLYVGAAAQGATLYTIDPATAVATPVGTGSVSLTGGLAF